MELTILPNEDVYQIINKGKMIGALRNLDSDWELLPLEDILDELPIFERDLDDEHAPQINLDTPTINLITAEIENHLNHLY
ncbi:hypothetical protein DHW03_13885 [Pedobacter yonginense]|uniref:Uncharacterized protein n=1 Tax=Pedobacter yonginense TaxID=651869 RepID=A0A317EMG7_9SPHI|nr:hypothetical protein DHW03_13885 [Pedobacter yonginense]